MTIDWAPIDAELARWSRPPAFWWRDDDAAAATPALDRLLAAGERAAAPIALAVIPAALAPSLPERLSNAAARALVHGWAHRNHAPADAKKAEFGAHRPLNVRLTEAAAGLAKIQSAFGAAATAAFTPPWNRIADDMAPMLAALGFTGLSTAKPRRAAEAAPGLVQVNSHIDPIAWRDGRGLRATAEIVAETAALLAHQRQGVADAAEPLGFLTHHLVHDAAVWAFSEAFATGLTARGAVWRDPALLFPQRDAQDAATLAL